MQGISVTNLTKRFDQVDAIRNVELDIEPGEFLVLLGPSGCGKTTTLRCIAGLERPSGGEIQLGSRTVYSELQQIDIPARERRVGLVFQNYALYPHMTVYKNIAFGLKMRGFPRNQIAQRVREALRFVELEGCEDRRPAELSGGQRQRVAVARMVAGRPDFLLFDEPLSNLDPKLRGSVRTELRRLHGAMGATSIYVTHDQTEAFVLANRIAVMQDGEIVQVDDADGIYHFPKTAAVADFTGNPRTNLIPGQVHAAAAGTILIPEVDPYCFIPLPAECRPYSGRRMIVHVRPEDVEIAGSPGEDLGSLTVMAIMNEGPDVLVHLCFEDRRTQVIVRSRRGETAALETDEAVGLRLRRGNLYDRGTGWLVDSFGYER